MYRIRLRLSLVVGALGGLSALSMAGPPTYSWRSYRPGNTGIQGDYNEALWIAPDAAWSERPD